MKNILFICTGNTCRSPMAQAFFNSICEKRQLDMHAQSAGLATVSGIEPSENAQICMSEKGLDISQHKSAFLPELALSKFDLFVTMTPQQGDILESLGIPKKYIVTLSKPYNPQDKYNAFSGISDPYGKSLDEYRKCRDEIYLAVNSLIDTL